ncbi:restriction endonuclease subunit S [Epibacterium ulvae]|uniref:restriction endonuclease subunit S n=1 Tax=Epibacterium ulvae TaxID=1156985 RepID=UPI0024929923|nr:restriction endonuclease subunit S [Epibacterium ulvae]
MTQTEQQNVPALRFPGFEEAWEALKLGNFLEIKSASRVHKDEWRETGVPFFRSSDVVSAFKGNENKKAFISNTLFEKLAKKSGKVAKGDLLVTGGGSIGIPYLIQSDAPLYFKDADLLWVRNSGEVEGFYLYTFFSGPIFRRYVQSITHIGTISHYTIEQARATPINLPTLPEQQKIAGFLGAVDERIAQVTRKKTLLEDYKKGCMQQLFSQSIRFKDDQGNDFPDWEEKLLGDVFSWVNTNSLSRERLTYEGGTVQNIHYGDIHTKFSANFRQGSENVPFVKDGTPSDFKDELFCKVGDVIIADASEDYADIGKAIEVVELAEIPLVAGLHTFIARPASTDLEVGFSGYLLRCENMRRQIVRIAQGISVLGVSKRNIEKLSLSLPHPDEQRKIADFLSAIDTKIDLLAKELEQAKTFKKGLLQQMFV